MYICYYFEFLFEIVKPLYCNWLACLLARRRGNYFTSW